MRSVPAVPPQAESRVSAQGAVQGRGRQTQDPQGNSTTYLPICLTRAVPLSHKLLHGPETQSQMPRFRAGVLGPQVQGVSRAASSSFSGPAPWLLPGPPWLQAAALAQSSPSHVLDSMHFGEPTGPSDLGPLLLGEPGDHVVRRKTLAFSDLSTARHPGAAPLGLTPQPVREPCSGSTARRLP